MPPLLVVAGALVRGGAVLVQQRPADKAMAGLWEFPGGKVDAGEAPAEALARELNEELGVSVDPVKLTPITFGTGLIGSRDLVLLLYRVAQWTGEPQALETPELRWVDADALRDLPMPPADLPLIAPLCRILG
ncbi:(deoxy)nucleoside triphosphate pyrophosphohydrolase [Sphingomonas aerophila]|nr:(deoxy)nucleoside triphosphate pyrophosphohydrolase [Sphingomonas aerophila]